MNVNRVTLITLGVENLERACAYYAAIGWVLEKALPEVAFYEMNGMKLGFFSLDGLAKETGRDKADLKTGAMTLAQNFGSEAEVEAAFECALRAGGAAVTHPTKTAWGGYSSYVADPDGHLWEYAHNPFWELDADGLLK